MQHNENGMISLYIKNKNKKIKSTFQFKILYPVKIFITNKIKKLSDKQNRANLLLSEILCNKS